MEFANIVIGLLTLSKENFMYDYITRKYHTSTNPSKSVSTILIILQFPLWEGQCVLYRHVLDNSCLQHFNIPFHFGCMIHCVICISRINSRRNCDKSSHSNRTRNNKTVKTQGRDLFCCTIKYLTQIQSEGYGH